MSDKKKMKLFGSIEAQEDDEEDDDEIDDPAVFASGIIRADDCPLSAPVNCSNYWRTS